MMQEFSVGISTATTALNDVVKPGLDPDSKKAQEQLRLSVDYVEFVSARLGYLHDKATLELGLHLRMLDAVLDTMSAAGRDVSEAKAVHETAESVRTRPTARTVHLTDAIQELLPTISDLVRDAGSDPQLAETVQREVLRFSRPWVEFERLWYHPLDIDQDSLVLESLDDVFDEGLDALIAR